MMYWYRNEANPHLEKTEQQLFLRNTFCALTLITEYTDSVADTFDKGLNVTMKCHWCPRVTDGIPDNIVYAWLCQYFRWLSTILHWLWSYICVEIKGDFHTA